MECECEDMPVFRDTNEPVHDGSGLCIHTAEIPAWLAPDEPESTADKDPIPAHR
jgi:hypothetical protein